ncbi:hypothetical protein VMCG_05579 [Cytospora schulzeri]|uniref:Major facilitator superfamily (MFS) profile domain-containing protein n=1 Tax=Cytospora schulzeri TaxID=448051 RepID=A0A423WF92_9PEZI|nr:hypothetical protein VMCG_05579 [Valsa malicola]
MSLAQRRTAPEGINIIPEDGILENGYSTSHGHLEAVADVEQRRGSTATQTTLIPPGAEGEALWQTISYDAFAQHPPQQYEAVFPPDEVDHLAAYEVSGPKRIAQITFAVVACVLASGIVCGFAALKPILIAEGVYRSLCPADWSPTTGKESQMPCPEQDMRLNLFFIMASITLNMSTVLAGYVLDNHGRRMCYLLAAAILAVGSGCMALAFHLGEGALEYFDGYITGNLLLGLGGTFLFVSSYQLSNAFPRHAGLVVALVTGAFDASAAVFLFYRLAYEATSHAFKPSYFFLGFAVLVPLMLVVAEFTLMPKSGYNTRSEYQAEIEYAKDFTRDVHDSDDELYANKPREVLRETRLGRASEREAHLEAIEAVAGTEDERRADREAARERLANSGVYGFLQRQPVSRQMMTAWFWLLLCLTVLQMMRMNYFIATVRSQYRYMLDGEEGAEKVNALFDIALPVAGVITTPFVGVLLNEVPVYGTLGVLTVLIVVLGAFNCVSTLWAGYATVIAFVIFRPLYYSAVSDYASKVFGYATFGRIYGTLICVSGIGQFVQPALDTLTHGPLHNNPVPVNLFFAVGGSITSAALTFYVYAKTSENGDGHGGKHVSDLRFGEDLADDERRALLHEGGRVEAYGSALRDR